MPACAYCRVRSNPPGSTDTCQVPYLERIQAECEQSLSFNIYPLTVCHMRGPAHRTAGLQIGHPIAGPLALIAFWGGMAAAARAYQPGYDWRYQTISVLLYADQNPKGYLWAWAGLELCGLAGIAWTAALIRRPEIEIARPRTLSLRVLQLGFVCMCFAVLPDQLLPVPKGHEACAILAFLGICIGVICQMWVVTVRRPSGFDRGTLGRSWTKIRRVMPLLPLLPLVLAGLTQAYLALERPDLPWVNPSWRARGISPFLSFGLWEWISCAVFSVCLLVLWHRRPAATDQR